MTPINPINHLKSVPATYVALAMMGGTLWGKTNIRFLDLNGRMTHSRASPLLGAVLGPVLLPGILSAEAMGYDTHVVISLSRRDSAGAPACVIVPPLLTL